MLRASSVYLLRVQITLVCGSLYSLSETIQVTVFQGRKLARPVLGYDLV
jgi:hypothetical protein